jgi:NADH-quinone oxidoreductase subunit H
VLTDFFLEHLNVIYPLTLIIVKMLIFFIVFLTIIAYLTLLERRLLGFFQIRYGPNRVGPQGLLQPVADGIKLLFKEEMTIKHANKIIFILAPIIVTITAFIPFAVIPFGNIVFPAKFAIGGQTFDFTIAAANKGVLADINVGILYIFAISSLSVFGIMMAGWASNNKYALLGGIRASAQMISYELALGLSVVGILMTVGSLSMVDIVNYQAQTWWGFIPKWFVIKQPIAFVLFIVCAFAEAARTPFDFAECENELVAGYQMEYSGMKFALFYLCEYTHMLTVSAIIVTLFFGGWHGPMLPESWGAISNINYVTPPIYFIVKTLLMVSVFIWVRATFPRLRYDKLMQVGWKFLLPATLVNIMISPVLMWIFGDLR